MRVLVTGGASGLGAALSAAFLDRGDDVLIGDINEPSGFETLVPRSSTTGDSVVGEGASATISKPHSLHLDVRSDDDWAAAHAWVTETWGGLDVLVNNAGVGGGGRVDVAGMDEWQWITEINLFGVVRGTRTFVPMFKQQRSGQIVNIASLAGLVHPAGMGSYNAVKAGVVAFSETCAHELAEYDVRCSVVCPSYFRTNLIANTQALAPPGGDEVVAAVSSGLVADAPLGPEEIAAAVLEGLDRGDELILPDDAGRAAYQLKVSDRAAYDKLMRKQAARLNAMASQPTESPTDSAAGR
jgi:NAD(P)-dependent dehydrogenase (short-subunit alcohol dehydrogenase family)